MHTIIDSTFTALLLMVSEVEQAQISDLEDIERVVLPMGEVHAIKAAKLILGLHILYGKSPSHQGISHQI